MRRVPFFLAAAFISAILIFATQPPALRAASPDNRPGTLIGIVVNAKGAPVAGAQVLWQNADGQSIHVLHTDAQGRFRVERLYAGLYDLRATSGTAWSEWERNILVRPGSEVSITLRLILTAPPGPPAVPLAGKITFFTVPVPAALPHDPAVDPHGDIWFTLQNVNRVARFDTKMLQWRFFTPPTANSGPHGLVSDAQGNIWFTENSVGKIGRIDAQTGDVTEYRVPNVPDPHTPVFAFDGSLWFTAEDANLITRMDTATGKMQSFAVPTQNALPYGIAVGLDGGLWFCEFGSNKIGRLDPEMGVVQEFALDDATARPRRLVVVGSAIYFSDYAGGRLGRFDVATHEFKLWPTPSGASAKPYAIAADAAGNVWYVETGVNKLVRFDPRTEKFTVFALPDGSDTRNIARDARGRLWLTLPAANQIAVVQ
ncbi:MAG: carboxypeptidase regulatory-like domain-containing protein [Candidatus Acidiferrales bacterium]